MRNLLLIVTGGFACIPAFGAGLLATDNPATHQGMNQVYLSVDATVSNNVVPVDELQGKWMHYDPASGKNFALVMGRAETGVEYNGWSFGLLTRSDWWARANKDSLDLAYRDKLKVGVVSGRSYTFDYQLKGFDADGIKLAKASSVFLDSNLRLDWGGAASLLNGERYRSDRVSGFGSVNAARQIGATVVRDNANTNMNLSPEYFNPFVHPGTASGQGYALDLGIRVSTDSGYRFDITIADALGKMYWKNIPKQTTTGSNINYSYDQNGNRNSTVTWLSSGANITETLAPKAGFRASIPMPIGFLELGDSHYRGVDFPDIGLRYAGIGWEGLASYDIRTKSAALELSGRYLSCSLRSDSLQSSDARTQGAVVGVHIPF